jgi:predicted transglutaminase-like cysteine proteinase
MTARSVHHPQRCGTTFNRIAFKRPYNGIATASNGAADPTTGAVQGGAVLRVLGVLLLTCACAATNAARADEYAFRAMLLAPQSGLALKWQGVQQRMAEDEARLSACRAETWMCSDDELLLEAIIASGRAREGRARIGEINRAVNLAIRPVSDEQRFGIADRWSGPLETIVAGAGDCEDYAILKLLALQEAGIAREDLKLLIVHERGVRSDHAVAAVRLDERWLVLDNRGFALVDLEYTRYRVLAQLDPDAEGQRYASLDPAVTGALRGAM